MSKLSFNKLGLVKNTKVVFLKYNEQEIEIQQYLPVNEKLELISNVINYSADEHNFANPLKISIYTLLEIVDHYTNINFTEKQKEDPCKLYDLIVSNGLSTQILLAIPEVELAELLTAIEDSVSSVYKYYNSMLGMLETINQDYSNVNFDLAQIQKALEDKNSIGLLQEIMPLINGTLED